MGGVSSAEIVGVNGRPLGARHPVKGVARELVATITASVPGVPES